MRFARAADASPDAARLRDLLRLEPGRRSYDVVEVEDSEFDPLEPEKRLTEIGIDTRSLMGVLYYLSNGVDVLPYQVDWDDGGGFAALNTGVAAGKTGANQSSVDCAGVNNAAVQVTVSGLDMSTASPGVYASTLTLLIEPQ